MEKPLEVKSKGRGRPSARLQRRVVEDLVRATELALDKKNAREITVREISTAAGTSEAMIRYYFGGKEGLLLEVIKEFMARSPHKDFDAVAGACLKAQSIRPLVDRLCEFHYRRPNMIKMVAVELLSSSSEVKELFLDKYGQRLNRFIQKVIEELRDQGVYRSDLNAAFVAMSLLRLVVAPIMESAVAGSSYAPPEIRNGEWASFMTQTIDMISKEPETRSA